MESLIWRNDNGVCFIWLTMSDLVENDTEVVKIGQLIREISLTTLKSRFYWPTIKDILAGSEVERALFVLVANLKWIPL